MSIIWNREIVGGQRNTAKDRRYRYPSLKREEGERGES